MVQAFDSKHNRLNFYHDQMVHIKTPPNQLLASIMESNNEMLPKILNPQ